MADAVQLGYLGEEIPPGYPLTVSDSFVGGSPIWNNEKPSAVDTRCGVCGDEMLLLLQTNADTSNLYRTLYMFFCVKGACQSSPLSSKAFRWQARYCVEPSEEDGQQVEKTGLKSLMLDDWGAAGKDDWGTGEADEWGASGKDDWGATAGLGMENGEGGNAEAPCTVEETNLVDDSAPEQEPSEKKDDWGHEAAAGWAQTQGGDKACSGTDESLEELTRLHEAMVKAKEKYAEGDGGRSKKGKAKAKGKQQPKALNPAAQDFQPVLSSVFNCDTPPSASTSAAGAAFPSYVICYDAEPSAGPKTRDDDRMEEKAKEAMAEEGAAAGAGGAGGAGWGSEEHETTKGDKQFRVFRKRVARSPEQVLRYQWGGEPLWQWTEGQGPAEGELRCERCGGALSFELQAMSGLLYQLSVEAFAPPGDVGMDFAVAAMYCCSRSCGEDGAADGEGLVQELLFVQRDPCALGNA